MVTPSQLTVLITAIGYPCRTYTMYISHRNPQLLKMSDQLLKQSNAKCLIFRQAVLQKFIHFTFILHFFGLKIKF